MERGDSTETGSRNLVSRCFRCDAVLCVRPTEEMLFLIGPSGICSFILRGRRSRPSRWHGSYGALHSDNSSGMLQMPASVERIVARDWTSLRLPEEFCAEGCGSSRDDDDPCWCRVDGRDLGGDSQYQHITGDTADCLLSSLSWYGSAQAIGLLSCFCDAGIPHSSCFFFGVRA